jgi:hypothetical protein
MRRHLWIHVSGLHVWKLLLSVRMVRFHYGSLLHRMPIYLRHMRVR